MARVRPPVGNNPNIPVPVARELRKVAQVAFDAQDRSDTALAGLSNAVSKNPADLNQVSQYVSKQIQANGAFPISLTGLVGNSAVTSINTLSGPVIIVGTGITVTVAGTGASQQIKLKLTPTGVVAGTYTLAKITVGGSNGSFTVGADGRITTVVAPT
jgi:hypothetical protein